MGTVDIVKMKCMHVKVWNFKQEEVKRRNGKLNLKYEALLS
jgi:hypothetical protein